MNIRFFLPFFIFVFVLPNTGRAFVPQAPHLLHLVIEQVKRPAGIETSQIKTIANFDSADRKEEVWLDERLMYLFPDRLRSETTTLTGEDFTVESDFEFIKVKNGQTVSRTKSPIDLYTDILLYRDDEMFLQGLISAGIDVSTVTLKRYRGMICYVIGKPAGKKEPFPGLWVDKDTFFPVRYVVKKDDFMVENVYSNWQKISRSWYPMEVSIRLDNQVFATVTVGQIKLKSDFPRSLFDIPEIERLYPEQPAPDVLNNSAKEVNEVRKRIEEFKKLYE